jgi:hypothetical protein
VDRRVKNDERDARDLADLLRLGRRGEATVSGSSDMLRRERDVFEEDHTGPLWTTVNDRSR